MQWRIFIPALCVSLLGWGCNTAQNLPVTNPIRPVTTVLTPPVYNRVLRAIVTPPLGWVPDPLKQSARHRHQVWVSPTGDTAYGIIYFNLPLPCGDDLALWGFLQEMKKVEGEARLLSKQNDYSGLRFVAEGGLYTIRAKLQVDGFHGWVIYAGTLRSRPVNPPELDIAQKARESTRLGP
jgi:hypothetical protein